MPLPSRDRFGMNVKRRSRFYSNVLYGIFFLFKRFLRKKTRLLTFNYSKSYDFPSFALPSLYRSVTVNNSKLPTVTVFCSTLHNVIDCYWPFPNCHWSFPTVFHRFLLCFISLFKFTVRFKIQFVYRIYPRNVA